MSSIQDWYNERAADFRDCPTVEQSFLGLDPNQQDRLNEMRLAPFRSKLDVVGKRVLEYGCGHGRFALCFQGYEEYLGIDFASELVALGNRRIRAAGLETCAEIVQGDFASVPPDAGTWDLVGSLGGFPYASEPQKFLSDMALHVRPGGQVFVDNYLSSWVWDPVRRLKWALRPPTGGVARTYAEPEMRAMFARAGLTEMQWMVVAFPLLDGLFARHGWRWPWRLRDFLSRNEPFHPLGIVFSAIGRRPI
jgi:SAM-dependent methyltransferase